MSPAHVVNCLGWFALVLSALMLLPVFPAIGAGDNDGAVDFFTSSVLCGFGSGALVVATRGERRRFQKGEAYLIVVLVWPLLALLGAVPLFAGAPELTYWQALFEAVSGLTTTGSSVFTSLDGVSQAVLFWRALLQWGGGFVTVLLAIVIMTYLGGGGMQQFESALPKGEGGDIPTRLAQTARDLAWVYMLLTLVCALALWICGVRPLEGLSLAFGALSTGGFAFRDGGVAALGNWQTELVLAMFMLVGAMNMTQHWALMHARVQGYQRAIETRYFIVTVLGVFFMLTVWTWLKSPELGLAGLRAGFFRTASLLSTTGMSGAGDAAVPLPAILVIGLLLVGGCAGSTAGGMKLFRVAILFKQAQRELARLRHPHGIVPLRIANQPVSEAAVGGVWHFFFLMVLCLAGLSVLLGVLELTPTAAIATTVAAMTNAGPLATAIYADTPAPATLSVASQAVVMFAMILGRLELLAFFTLLNPAYWRQ